MIQLHDVSKTYGNRLALQRTSLCIAPQQTTVLIGPSGSGKSTFLRLMLGLVPADSGRVVFGEEELGARTRLRLRRRMGYVTQGGGLFPHLTARSNIDLVARQEGWDRARVGQRVEELARLTQFPPDGLARFPLQLSGGQRQRVSLMRALMLDPDVLLLDEPLGALDPMIRSELQSDLKQIFVELGKTVVLVTHDLAEAAFFGDTIVLFRDGAVVQMGTLQKLLSEPADDFVRRFVTAQRSLHSGLEA